MEVIKLLREDYQLNLLKNRFETKDVIAIAEAYHKAKVQEAFKKVAFGQGSFERDEYKARLKQQLQS